MSRVYGLGALLQRL